MSDLIRRSDAIEAIEGTDWYHINERGEMVSGATSDMEAWYKADDVYKALEAVPSADRPQEWIPCSERLPEESGDYLVWMKYGMNAPTYWIESYDADEKAFGEWFDIDLFDSGMRREFMVLQNIYAWMPLPAPWKGADDE